MEKLQPSIEDGRKGMKRSEPAYITGKLYRDGTDMKSSGQGDIHFGYG